MKKKVIYQEFHGKVFDNPEIRVWDGDLNKAIKVFKSRLARLGLFSELKRRRLDPGIMARRRAKKLLARQRLKTKQKKARRR